MFVDTDIERYPVTVVSGTDISTVGPTAFDPVLTPIGLILPIEGPAWASALAKIVRPLCPTSNGNLIYSFDLTPDEGTVVNGQAREFDLRVTPPSGWTYPFDMQIYWPTGELLIATGVAASLATNAPPPTWQHSGIFFGPPVAGQQLRASFVLNYNDTTHVCSILSASGSNGSTSVNGAVPTALQNQPAFQAGWQPSQVVQQNQIGVNGSGGAASDTMVNATISYVGT